jgi:hypothetical protein
MPDLMQTLARAACVALLACCGSAALGGGSDEYEAETDAEGKGPVYFGFVRDNRGSSVPEAQVMLRPKAGDPVVIKSNTLGLYRSHINGQVRPDDVEISCEKTGYKQVRVARRNPAGSKDAMIETNCTMQRL